MGIEYKLGKIQVSKYDKLYSDDLNCIVRELSIFGFGDCITFKRQTGSNSTFEASWTLRNIGCFKELRSYTRLFEMPPNDIERLAARGYEALFGGSKGKDYYSTVPKFNQNNPFYRQIVEEMNALKKFELQMIDSGSLTFPKISGHELRWIDLW